MIFHKSLVKPIFQNCSQNTLDLFTSKLRNLCMFKWYFRHGFDPSRITLSKSFVTSTNRLSYYLFTSKNHDHLELQHYQRVLNEGPGFLRSYDSAPLPTPYPIPPSASCLSFSAFLCVADRAYWRETGGGGGGWGWARSLIIRPLQSLVFYI